jgi:hypothetical protein
MGERMRAGDLILVDVPNTVGARLFEVSKIDKKSGKMYGYFVKPDLVFDKRGMTGRKLKRYRLNIFQYREIFRTYSGSYEEPKSWRSKVSILKTNKDTQVLLIMAKLKLSRRRK